MLIFKNVTCRNSIRLFILLLAMNAVAQDSNTHSKHSFFRSIELSLPECVSNKTFDKSLGRGIAYLDSAEIIDKGILDLIQLDYKIPYWKYYLSSKGIEGEIVTTVPMINETKDTVVSIMQIIEKNKVVKGVHFYSKDNLKEILSMQLIEPTLANNYLDLIEEFDSYVFCRAQNNKNSGARREDKEKSLGVVELCFQTKQKDVNKADKPGKKCALYNYYIMARGQSYFSDKTTIFNLIDPSYTWKGTNNKSGYNKSQELNLIYIKRDIERYLSKYEINIPVIELWENLSKSCISDSIEAGNIKD